MTAANLSEKAADSAIALAAQVEAVAKVAAASVEATTHSFSERIAPLEQLRFEQGGAKVQQHEAREQVHWTTERVIAVVAIVVAVIEFYMRTQA